MRKILLIGFILLLVCPSLAQNTRMGTYTSPDGVVQVSYMRGWRIGAIEPDLESPDNITLREMPEAYQLNLLRSNPDAEIVFYAADAAELIPEDEDPLAFLQTSFEELMPDAQMTRFMLGEQEVLELDIRGIESDLALGSSRIRLEGVRRFFTFVGRNNWVIVISLIAEDESLDEEFITIAESFRFKGSNRDILSLTGNLSITVPENWFRHVDLVDTRKQWEVIGVKGLTDREFCVVSLDLIALDTPEFEFPEEGTNNEYFEAYLNGRENNYQPLDTYAEHLAEGISLYMAELEDDYLYRSIQVLEETVVISMFYLGEGFCVEDYLSMINSVREE